MTPDNPRIEESDRPEDKMAPIDLVDALLVAANGDPADWSWNREIATALLQCPLRTEG